MGEGADRVWVLGVRHFGVGSAERVVRALERIEPQCILVEGPADGNALVSWLDHPDLLPPVALLVYAADTPAHCAVYPFAEFSPEWQALAFARRHGITAAFCDLPQTHALGLANASATGFPGSPGLSGQAAPPQAAPPQAGDTPWQDEVMVRVAALGDGGDGALWWDGVVERLDPREDSLAMFAALLEAMTLLRQGPGLGSAKGLDRREALREAWMRRCVRKALKSVAGPVAVVCGAWHGPALLAGVRGQVTVRDDDALLKGLPRVKTRATWMPWTFDRLTRTAAYGAGIQAPGWSQHCWRERHNAAGRLVSWLVVTAQTLRSRGFEASAADVQAGVALAETLMALRPGHGLEFDSIADATAVTLCRSEAAPLAELQQTLWVGNAMGRTPKDVPKTPLQMDLETTSRRLRWEKAGERTVTLDLRKPQGAEGSVMLHRLVLLAVPWGEELPASRGLGTFKERWRLLPWRPEHTLALLEAGVWGTTLGHAATAKGLALAESTGTAQALVALLATLLKADVPRAVGGVVARLQGRLAVGTDAAELLEAFTALVQLWRYGDARGTDPQLLAGVIQGLAIRLSLGLEGFCRGRNEAFARAIAPQVVRANGAVVLFDDPGLLAGWYAALRAITGPEYPGLLAGRVYRLLLELGRLEDEPSIILHRALTKVPAPRAAAWIEGLVAEDGRLLVHETALWGLLDAWLVDLDEATWLSLLPLLRRAFAAVEPQVRGLLLARVRPSDVAVEEGPATGEVSAPPFDHEAASAGMALVQRLLGLEAEPSPPAVPSAAGPLAASRGQRSQAVRFRRWRLVLGDAEGRDPPPGDDGILDATLALVYGNPASGDTPPPTRGRRGGRGASRVALVRGLREVRQHFPGDVVQVMQRDLLARLNLTAVLENPELAAAMTVDVALVADVLSVSEVLSPQAQANARRLVAELVQRLLDALQLPLEQAVRRGRRAGSAKRRPGPLDIDWPRTLKANLCHYQPDYGTVVPHTLVGHRHRKQPPLKTVILAVDQSGSMAGSAVYACLMATVLAGLPSVETRLFAFDTQVVDLTPHLPDPLGALFGLRLGGGTDIAAALAHCRAQIHRPADTTLVLLSDLFDGSDGQSVVQHLHRLTVDGVQGVVLLALDDHGTPSYNAELAHQLSQLDIPVFACSPEQFPDLMAAALSGEDLAQWTRSGSPEQRFPRQ